MLRLPAILLLLQLLWSATAGALTLTDEEQAWLSAHPQLRLGVDASWPPFEYRDQEGRYQGLAADYITLLEDRLGVAFKPIEPISWTAVLEEARNGKLDLLPGIMSTPDRQNYLSFTRPYLDFPIVILAHQGGAQPRDLKDLYGLKVAVVENYAPHELLRTHHPDLNLVALPNVSSDYVQSLWQTLLASARQRGELTLELEQQFAWEVALIRDRSINAFALPGGYLGVHLGLIAAVSSPDELASVLAHELSHVTQRHIARMISQQGKQGPLVMGAMILGMLAASRTPSASGMSAANAVMVGGQAAAIQSQLNFSRDMEREADRVGYGVMTEAGFEPQGFVTMFEKLQQASRLNDNGSFPYLRSHPMTTERIADAQARQQLLPARQALSLTPLHAMMAARAQVLTSPGVDVLRALAAQADPANIRAFPLARQAGALYAGVMADMRQREFAAARQHLARLQALPGLDVSAQRVIRLLTAELALASGDAAQALSVLDVKAFVLAPNDRATRMLLAQSRIATRKPAQAKQASDDLALWLSQRPRDASAWTLLSSAYEQQGDGLRAIRAQAESRAVELDYGAAVDRFKAAQALAHAMAREGKLDRAGHVEASIVDARLRELERLRREQALER